VLVTAVMLLRACRQFASSEALKHTRVQHSPKTEYLLDRTLRVDHAGEFGAVQIYKGQLAVLGHTDVALTLQVQSVHSFRMSSFHSRTLLHATLALSLVVSLLKLVCCDFSIFSAVMPQSPAACLTWYGISLYTHHLL